MNLVARADECSGCAGVHKSKCVHMGCVLRVGIIATAVSEASTAVLDGADAWD